MAKLSVLGKLKFNETFFFPLKKEWLYYIQDNDALLEKIDTIATEENGEIGIKFLKRYGINPKENETVKEYLEAREKADKAYLEKIKAIGQKTGLSTAEIEGVVVNDGSIRERIEQVMVDALDGVKSDSVEQKVETAAIVQQSILSNRKKTRELARESIELVEPYLDELNALFKDRETTYETYNKALLANFLGSPRRVVKLKDNKSSVDFTIQDINDMSQFMVVKLYQDYLWQDITQWQNPETEKPEPEKSESESTEDDEKNE
jgi:hypothetical protein